MAPQAEQRAKVRLWTAGGIGEEHQAMMLGICRNTLRKRFPKELAEGASIELARNLERLSKAADDGNVTAMKHLDAKFAAVSAQASWKEDAPSKPAGKPAKVGRKEAAIAAAEEAMTGSDGWGSDLMPDSVVRFPGARKA